MITTPKTKNNMKNTSYPSLVLDYVIYTTEDVVTAIGIIEKDPVPFKSKGLRYHGFELSTRTKDQQSTIVRRYLRGSGKLSEVYPARYGRLAKLALSEQRVSSLDRKLLELFNKVDLLCQSGSRIQGVDVSQDISRLLYGLWEPHIH